MADQTSEAAFDRQDLLDRLGGDEQVLAVVVGVFVGDVPTQLNRLEAAVRDGDEAVVRERAHGLKGAAANLSADALREASWALERAASASDIDALPDLLDAVKQEILRLVAALEKEIESE